MNKLIILLITFLFAGTALGHGGDHGPSSLEDDFAETSEIYLPVNYSRTHGLSFDFSHHGHDDYQSGEDTHGDETGLEINLSPVLFAGHDRFTRLISQALSSTNDSTIEASDENDEYLIIENRKWDLGLGIGPELHLPGSLLGIGVSVNFIRGKNYYTIRTLKSKNEKRIPLKLPISKENLATWKVGDQLSYATKGSMVFDAMMGIEPFIHFGPAYIHTGVYSFKAQLVSSHTMEIEVTTMKTKSIEFEASVLPFDLQGGKSKGHLNTLIYQFDLRNDNALDAIYYLFNGRLDLTNHAMLISGGEILVRTEMQNSSIYISARFGFPVLYINGGGAGTYQSAGTIQSNEPGGNHPHLHDVFTTTYQRERYTRGILSQHKWENQSVVSTIMKGDHPLISSIFSWSLSQDRMKSNLFIKRLGRIANVFGSTKLQKINFPQHHLKYLKADLLANLSGKDLLPLLNEVQLKSLLTAAQEKLKTDFKIYGHKSFCRLRSYNNCLARYRNLINIKYENINMLRTSVELAYNRGEMNQVTKPLTQLVKILFSSKYLTQSLISARPDLKIELRLEGERIKKHILTL
jgi:hypothetical protein